MTLLKPATINPFHKTLRTFYRPEMVPSAAVGFSQSPLKPALFLARGKELDLDRRIEIDSSWSPYTKEDFLLAHERKYVSGFFGGAMPQARSNNLSWSPEFADSVRYTNASLYAAILAAVSNPTQVTLSPTSGFHHATPGHGGGFCTFSGQVIAALKLWREQRLVGAWIDLDAHFGNSIDDTRSFAPELNEAIPPEYHINPTGSHSAYLSDFAQKLEILSHGLSQRKVHYVVLCHGADSHEWDDLGGQLTTHEWLTTAEMVYRTVASAANGIGFVPLTLCLFGGYRADHYNSVLDLHWASVSMALDYLAGGTRNFLPQVRARREKHAS